MSESNQPPTSPDGEHAAAPTPERFWGPAPELPPQPEYQLPPDPQASNSLPVFLHPTWDLASWIQRVFAAVIDGALLIPWVILVRMGASLAGISATQSVGTFLFAAGLILGLAFGFWNSIIRQGLTGSSLGKSWIGIRVIGEDSGYEVGIGRNLVRSFLHILDSIFYVGYVWPLWDKKNQTFADKIMHTVVVEPRLR